jgi:hypothetical protein
LCMCMFLYHQSAAVAVVVAPLCLLTSCLFCVLGGFADSVSYKKIKRA